MTNSLSLRSLERDIRHSVSSRIESLMTMFSSASSKGSEFPIPVSSCSGVLRLPLRSPVRKFSAPASHPARVCSLWCFHSAISAGSKFLVPTSHPTRVCSLQRSPSAISTGSEFPVPTFHPPRVFLRQRSSSVISTGREFSIPASHTAQVCSWQYSPSPQGVSFISLRLIYSNLLTAMLLLLVPIDSEFYVLAAHPVWVC